MKDTKKKLSKLKKDELIERVLDLQTILKFNQGTAKKVKARLDAAKTRNRFLIIVGLAVLFLGIWVW